MQEPNFEQILNNSREYYGHTEAAIEFAAEKYKNDSIDYLLSHYNGAVDIKRKLNEEIAYKQYLKRMAIEKERTGLCSIILTQSQYFNRNS